MGPEEEDSGITEVLLDSRTSLFPKGKKQNIKIPAQKTIRKQHQ
jgi:hypothetical protein